jgi:hypothetical protein
MVKTTNKTYYKRPRKTNRRSRNSKSYYKPMPQRRNNIFWRRGMNKTMRLISLLNVEFKEFNTSDVDAIDDAGMVYPCTNIGQGDTNTTRDGSSLKLVGFQYSIKFTKHASATNSLVRIIVLIDKQTNGAIYSVDDVLLNIAALSFYNLDNERRFVILDDLKLILDVNKPSIVRDFSAKLQTHLRFNNAAGAITSLTESSLSVIAISDEDTNTPTLEILTRVMFVDN